jgi:predicted nucleic acid-binding protein
MATISYLLDSDVIIDWLRGQQRVRQFFRSKDARLYCSSITRKELLNKPGLSNHERRRILSLMRHVRVLSLNQRIVVAASELLVKYSERPLQVNDALIAATAWTKNLPLLTRNRRHYEFIEEIQLADLP